MQGVLDSYDGRGGEGVGVRCSLYRQCLDVTERLYRVTSQEQYGTDIMWRQVGWSVRSVVSV